MYHDVLLLPCLAGGLGVRCGGSRDRLVPAGHHFYFGRRIDRTKTVLNILRLIAAAPGPVWPSTSTVVKQRAKGACNPLISGIAHFILSNSQPLIEK